MFIISLCIVLHVLFSVNQLDICVSGDKQDCFPHIVTISVIDIPTYFIDDTLIIIFQFAYM